MNTFFKSTVYAAFVGLTIFSSCSDEIKDFTVKPDGTEQGDGSTTTTETKNLIINATATGKKWVVEDVIYVGSPSAAENEVTIDNQSSGFTKFTVSKIGEGATSASFEGEIPANLSGKKLLVFYGNAADMKVAASKVTLDLASQNGSLMSATADYTGEENINATFSIENASAELKIQTTDVSGLTEATLSFDESSTIGFTSSKEFTADGVGTYTMQKSMTATLTAGEDDEYTISFIPTVSETPATMNISLKAAKASGDYTYKTKKEISSSSNYDVEIKSENVDNNLLGEGTEASPYIIDNVDKFMGMTETTDKFYQLSRDLDFTDIKINPITTFDGTFDGNGMTISNIELTINEGNGGLFAINNGIIKNLIVDKANLTQEGSINTNEGVGIIIGKNTKEIHNCIVKNSTIKSTITAGDDGDRGLGLLVGYNNGKDNNHAIISESHVEGGSIELLSGSTKKANIGGLVGFNFYGDIKYSSVKNKANIKYSENIGGGNIGGLSGFSKFCIIEGCSSSANVTTTSKTAITIAGFIGSAFSGGTSLIKGCYSTGHIELGNNGHTYSKFIAIANGAGKKIIQNCYTASTIGSNVTDNQAFVYSGKVANLTIEKCYYVNGTQTEIPNSETVKVSIEQKSAADLKNMASELNTGLDWTDYEFAAGTDAEPLIIRKK